MVSALLFVSVSGFAKKSVPDWLDSTGVGVKIEMGAHVIFQRDFEGFISNENGLFLYVTSLQPETYEDLIRPLKLSTDEKKLSSLISELKSAVGLPYMILPAKNYDGFCFWDSDVCDYNIKDHTATATDWLRLVSGILKENGIKVGYSYSIIDWHHPSQIQYKKDGSRYAVKMNTVINDGMKDNYIDYMTAQLKELVIGYGADLIFFDGDWAPWWTDEDAERLLRQLYEWNPDLMINNYLGNRKKKEWGDFDVYTSRVPSDRIVKQRNRPWVYVFPTFKGVDQIGNEVVYRESYSFIEKAIDVWSRGGTLLVALDVMNDALVTPASVGLMEKVGEWFRTNKKALKDVSISSDVRSPQKKNILFYRGNSVFYLSPGKGRIRINADWPQRLPFPENMKKQISGACLLTPEGDVPLSPVISSNGDLLYFELDSQYINRYESLFFPIYGYQYE